MLIGFKAPKPNMTTQKSRQLHAFPSLSSALEKISGLEESFHRSDWRHSGGC